MLGEQRLALRLQRRQLLGGQRRHLGVAARGQLLRPARSGLDAAWYSRYACTSGSISASALACLRYSLASLCTACDGHGRRHQLS